MKKGLMMAALAAILLLGVHVVLAGGSMEVRSSLSGDVTWVAAVGTQVSEGSELMRIATLTGEAVAARAAENGIVLEVLVKPGDKVFAGEAVARIAK